MISFIFIFISNLSYIISPLILPFKTYNPLITKDHNLLELIKKTSDEEIVETVLKNLIYIKLDMGNSKINDTLSNSIDFFLYMSKNDFYFNILKINESKYKKVLNYNNYILLKDILNFTYYNYSLIKTLRSSLYPYEKLDIVNETINLNIKNTISDKPEKIEVNIFIPFKDLIIYDHRPGILGLSFNNYNDNLNEEGDLVIGGYPHEYDSQHFNLEKLRNSKIYIDKNMHPDWNLLFIKSFIIINNDKSLYEYELNKNTYSTLRIEEFFILGTEEYFIQIQKIFFDKYINKSICQKQTHKKTKYVQNYYHIMCYFNGDKKKKKNFLKTFPVLKFYQNEMNYNFTLNSTDLFTIIPDNDRILFNIEYLENNNNWIFGKPFFKKYKLLFNEDEKTISYYIEDDNEFNKYKNFKFKYLNYIVIIILTMFAYIIFSLYIKKIKIKNKRKRNNNKYFELSEYLSQS